MWNVVYGKQADEKRVDCAVLEQYLCGNGKLLSGALRFTTGVDLLATVKAIEYWI